MSSHSWVVSGDCASMADEWAGQPGRSSGRFPVYGLFIRRPAVLQEAGETLSAHHLKTSCRRVFQTMHSVLAREFDFDNDYLGIYTSQTGKR